MLSKKLVARYHELKQQVPDCILFMQVGVFMQMLDEDAQVVSKIANIELQVTGNAKSPTVKCGFPVSALDKYVGRLIRADHDVAIALQDDTKERYIREIIRAQIERPVQN